MKKTITIVACVLLAILIFLLLFGRTLFAFCFLPLKEYMCITIPEGRYVSWDELYEYPSDIDDSATAWFPNCLLKWQIRQLAQYMEKNNLAIAPGQYEFYSTYYGEQLIDSFDYVDVNVLAWDEKAGMYNV